MKILVIGSGGREHALAWKLAAAGHTVLCAPGNPGIATHAECLPISASATDLLVTAARDRAVDLVVVGPEQPLVAGVADRMRAQGIPVFGPGALGARLEGSKVFCKEFFARHGLRTAAFYACDTVAEADQAILALGDEVVVKADGLAAGKGVVVCASMDEARQASREMLIERRFGDAGSRIIIERRLRGRELSIMAITDGERFHILAQAEDHKAVYDGDRGPNTGGMGTVSPCAWVSDALLARIEREIFAKTVAGLRADGIDYRGVLYAGLMIDADEQPWLLEYNCRFGDPETQPVLARLRGDLAPWLAGAAAGALPGGSMEWDERTAVCVILAAAGYPDAPRLGDTIHGLSLHPNAPDSDLLVFHAGTAPRDGALVTAGGRVLGVTARKVGLEAARKAAYEAISTIQFAGMHYRRDIGGRAQGA